MLQPDYETIVRLHEQHGAALVPLVLEVLADTLTPVSAYSHLTAGTDAPSFLLESVEGGERLGRYSFIGVHPRETLQLEPGGYPLGHAPMERLKALAQPSLPYLRPPGIRLPRFTGGAVGWLGYEIVTAFERLPRARNRPYGALPDGVWARYETVVAFDHLRHTILLIAHVRLDADDLKGEYDRAANEIHDLVSRLESQAATPLAGRLTQIPPPPADLPVFESSNFTASEYHRAVEHAKEYILAGDIFQVVPSQRFQRPTKADAFTIFRALRVINPSPYMYLLQGYAGEIIGASPEMLLRVEDGIVETHPIAGTRRRGHDSEEDDRLAAELQADIKERAEHLMLVDLGRNDVGRVSQPGTVRVPQFMEVERYSHVMHLVSTVIGQLRPEFHALDALQACFPAGTVSGAPKIRAMEIIAELETDQRGPYAGCVGYLGFEGSLDTAITIRTLFLKEGVAYVQAGGGIVADSEPDFEWHETQSKARALLRAIEMAEKL